MTPDERRALREQLSPGEREELQRRWMRHRGDDAERGGMPPHRMMSPEARRQMREQIREAQRLQRERLQDGRRPGGN